MLPMVFSMEKVLPLLIDSVEAQERTPTWGQMFSGEFDKDGVEPLPEGEFPKPDRIDGTKIPPGLRLVGDSGVYLLGNRANQQKDPKTDRLPLVYAEGANPDKDGDYYEMKRAMFGGDDGVEFIHGCWLSEGLKKGHQWLVIQFEGEAMEVKTYSRLPAGCLT